MKLMVTQTGRYTRVVLSDGSSGLARCSDKDEFVPEIGVMVAAIRALAKKFQGSRATWAIKAANARIKLPDDFYAAATREVDINEYRLYRALLEAVEEVSAIMATAYATDGWHGSFSGNVAEVLYDIAVQQYCPW